MSLVFMKFKPGFILKVLAGMSSVSKFMIMQQTGNTTFLTFAVTQFRWHYFFSINGNSAFLGFMVIPTSFSLCLTLPAHKDVQI